MKKILFICVFALAYFVAIAQSPVGVWKTIDDATGEAKSEVKIYEENGKLYGVVQKFLRKNDDPNSVCSKCSDWRKNQKMLGMMVIRDLKLEDGFYQGGKVLDPEKGKEYGCKIWLEKGNPNLLIVRGFLGISVLGRTQKWLRVQ